MTRRINDPLDAPSSAPTDSNQSHNNQFLVKTVITYTQTNAAGVEEKKKDSAVFKLADESSARMPWYVLRNFTVPRYLTEKLGPKEVGWQRIYEIKIIKMINSSAPNDITGIPLRIMTKGQLGLYCARWELNVDVNEFYSVEKAREMVQLRLEDEKAYHKHLDEYREGKQRTYPELDKVRGETKDIGTVSIEEFDKLEGTKPAIQRGTGEGKPKNEGTKTWNRKPKAKPGPRKSGSKGQSPGKEQGTGNQSPFGNI